MAFATKKTKTMCLNAIRKKTRGFPHKKIHVVMFSNSVRRVNLNHVVQWNAYKNTWLLQQVKTKINVCGNFSHVISGGVYETVPLIIESRIFAWPLNRVETAKTIINRLKNLIK